MSLIPKREGQGLNGLGVSITALIALLLLLPLASSSIIGVATFFDGEESIEYFPRVDHATSFPSTYAAAWESSGDTTYAATNSPNPPAIMPVSVVQVNGTHWEKIDDCVDPMAPIGSRCGDNGYRIAILHPIELNETLPIYWEFNAIGTSVEPCSTLPSANIALDYNIKVQKLKPLATLWQYEGSEYSIGSGSYSYNSEHFSFEFGGIDYCRISLTIGHEFSYYELTLLENLSEWEEAGNRFLLYLEWDDMFNIDSNLPLSQTTALHPFDFSANSLSTQYALWSIKTTYVTTDSYGLATNLLLVGLGTVFFLAAVASTPLWDPLKSRWKS